MTSPAGGRRGFHDGSIVVLLFVGLILVYNGNGTVLRSNDTRPARYASVSLVKRGDLDLDEFGPSVGDRGPGRPLPYFVTRGADGRVVSRFGAGVPVAAAPVFAVALWAAGGGMSDLAGAYVGKLASTLYLALAAVLLFLAARRLGARQGEAVVVALCYALLGDAWSLVSQGLYQHGPAEAFMALGILLLVRENAAAGAAFAAAVVCRPPDAIFAVFAAAYVVVRAWRRRRAWPAVGFLLAAAPLAALQLAYNAEHFGDPLLFSQMSRVVGPDDPHAGASYWSGSFGVGLLGQLVSPSRGLFVYSPIYLFLFWRPRETWSRLHGAVRAQLLAVLALVLVQASYYGWYGGWSFGYRMLVDATPALALALLPAVQRLREARRALVPFVAACAVSLTIHAAGAICFNPLGWDARPDVDRHPERLWQIRDSQLTYLFTHLRPRAR